MEKSGLEGTQAGAVMAVFGGLTLNELLAVGTFYWMYGWKNPVDGKRTFVYRPWIKRK